METSFILYYMPLIKNIVNTMFCSSIIIVFTLMYFVSNVNNVKLSNHRKLELMVTGVVFHLIAYLALPLPYSPAICAMGFGVWFALLMDIDIKKSYIGVFTWYSFAICIEVLFYWVVLFSFNIDAVVIAGTMTHYVGSFICNVIILLFTHIIAKRVKICKQTVHSSGDKQQIQTHSKESSK